MRRAAPGSTPAGTGGLQGGSFFGVAMCICSLADVLLALQLHVCPAWSGGAVRAGSRGGAVGAQLRARQLLAAGCVGAVLRDMPPALLGGYLPSAIARETGLCGGNARHGGMRV